MAIENSEKKIQLRVITPTETKVDQKVDMVVMRCNTGDMGVLPGHESYMCVLADGILRLLNRRSERRLAVFGGIAEIQDDVLTILTEEAHWPEDIDLDRAREAKEHLERKIQEKVDDLELLNDQVQLRRTFLKLDVHSFPVPGEFDEEV